jgi:pimeloyl-ACP methyl ester carboxylesterase/DNA-binding CsgD family transcriptional regulator
VRASPDAASRDGRFRPFRVPYASGVDEQAIRFTHGPGQRRIAWARSGDGPPLVLAGWWMSHLELNWREPRFRAFADALGRHRTVIRYDAPGTGSSSPGDEDDAPPPATVEGETAALAAVVEAAAPGRAVDLVAASSGAPIGLAYAATHPERVRRLVLLGGYASGSGIADARARAAITGLVREHWGLGSRVLADLFIPSADAAERAEFAAFQRDAASAERAAGALEAVYRFDVAALLGDVRVPAVVLHRRDDRAIPFALGRRLAAELPDASFVELRGADHYPWFGDADQALRATLHAIGVEARAAGPPEPPRGQDRAADLTARETEVLALIAAGLSDREIAERLVLSPHTVHRHVANLRGKLGLPTRAAAAAAAARRGLI